MGENVLRVNTFKGWRNNSDAKDIPPEYFYRVQNMDWSVVNTSEMEKILMPSHITRVPNNAPVKSLYEFRYLDANNVLRKEYIAVAGGTIYKSLSMDNPVWAVLTRGLKSSKCSFATYQDMLFIANGKNFVNVYDGEVVGEMGAPLAHQGDSGNLNGTYIYKMTYTYTGDEEIIGTKSNALKVTGRRINLWLPDDVDADYPLSKRTLYRNTANQPNIWYKVADFPPENPPADYDPTHYEDNISDVELAGGQKLIENNFDNIMPKPYFLIVAANTLFASVEDQYPTQLFRTAPGYTVLKKAQYIDISNQYNDNTPVIGIGFDFNKIVVGTKKNIFLVEPTGNYAMVQTKANIGILDGWSIQKVPNFGNFTGGLIFASTEKDIRVMIGNSAITEFTTLDNIVTNNYSEAINGEIFRALTGYASLCSAFFRNKYYLAVNGNKYVFDIRTQGWSFQKIENDVVRSSPIILSIINDTLYNGQSNGYIEKEFANMYYLGYDIPAFIESPQMFVSEKYHMVRTLKLWIEGSTNNSIKIDCTLDDKENYKLGGTFDVLQGAYAKDIFNENFYVTTKPMDYRNVNINRNVRWIKYRLDINGYCKFHGFTIDTV